MQQFLAVIAALATLLGLYRAMFGTREEFMECVRFWLTPDIISMFRYEYWDDHWAELKLWLWGGAGYGVWYGVVNI